MIDNINITRSRRKTVGITVNENGVFVRAPLYASDREIYSFIEKKESWIKKSLKKVEEQKKIAENTVPLTNDEIKALAQKALEIIPERVAFYAPKVGVTYNRITIRNQKTRWGSCSGKGNLNFNCLLMLTPIEVIDSVVVHELCHLKEMNHSKKFYNEVLSVYPDYEKWDKWLKDNGNGIMRRMK